MAKLTVSTQVRKSIRPSRPRPSLQPGAILILLAGRFRGKRVICLKVRLTMFSVLATLSLTDLENLPQGLCLVTGPFKANGVPLRRVNASYVIATSQKVDLSGVDQKTVERVAEEGYFKRDKAEQGKGEEAFFKQGEKPEVSTVMKKSSTSNAKVTHTLISFIFVEERSL